MKEARKLEQYFKGAANHWRLKIIICIAKNEGISVEELSDKLKGNFKTISQHTQTLHKAGLLDKKYRGRNVENRLSPYGKKFYSFIKTF